MLSPDRFIPEAITVEAGIWGVITWGGALVEGRVCPSPKSVTKLALFRGAFLCFTALFAIFSQIDFEVTRWLGQHMSASYIANFAGARDGKLLTRILSGDVLFSALALVQMICALLAAGWLWRTRGISPESRLSLRQSFVLALATILAVASPLWLRPSEKRWRRVLPASMGITQEAVLALSGAARPKDPKGARQDLIDFVYTGRLGQRVRPENEQYPLMRSQNVGKLSPEEYRALPKEQKVDIILIVFETMRGANTGLLGDPNSPLAAMPLVRKMIEEQSYYFPRMHSVGYPSVGGAMGLHLGMWPHHTRLVFSSFLHVRTLAFPEMLRDAGYRSLAILGADPSFSNFTPWFRRWYDEAEYDPSRHHDGPLVDRFIERYDQEVTSDTPLLMTLWTATTHPPYDVPEDSGVRPADNIEERYLQAMRYSDAHLARLLKHLQVSPRYRRTLVFLLGDHSQPTPWAWTHADEIGELSSGHTWTSLAVFGGEDAGIEAGRDDRAVSHIDLGPTILSHINLRHKNHFFGRDILKEKGERPIHSFRYGAVSEEIGSVRSVYRIDSDATLSYSFDRNDPRSYGSLEGGRREKTAPLPDIDRTRDMARYWAQMLEENSVLAPD